MRNVATLWRASITGLRPEIYFHENLSYGSKEYSIQCRIKNIAEAPARNVHVKLFVFHNQKLVLQDIRSGKNIAAGGTGAVQFRVSAAPDTEYGIAMAVAAQYDIPDLQYASTKRVLKTSPAKTKTKPPPVKNQRPIKDISRNTKPPQSGSSDSSGMSCSACPKRNPGTKLNIHRPPNNNGNYVYCRYYKNGQLAHQVPYINKKKEGWGVGYFSNGKLKAKTHYSNGCPDGPFVVFLIKNGKYYKAREGRNKECAQVKGSVKRYPAPK